MSSITQSLYRRRPDGTWEWFDRTEVEWDPTAGDLPTQCREWLHNIDATEGEWQLVDESTGERSDIVRFADVFWAERPQA